MSAAVSHVPSPADEPEFTAREFVEQVRDRGGRIHRMRGHAVFCLTNDPDLAQWLLDLGGATYKPNGTIPGYAGPLGGYLRAKGGMPEWDIWIHNIPVKDNDAQETIWEAAGRVGPTVEATDFA
jgi:hypothetical protein